MATVENNETLTGICNSALAMAGHTDFIDDIADDNPIAATCRMLVAQVAKEVQTHEFAAWDELISDVKLVLKGNNDTGITRRYAWNLPYEMLTPIECYEEDTGRPVRYEIYGGYLYCDKSEDVWLRYSRYSMNPAEWSVELKTCVIKLLSARIIASLVKDYKGSQAMEQQFWNYDYPMWAGSKKNKVRRNDYQGNDAAITQHYPLSHRVFDVEGY